MLLPVKLPPGVVRTGTVYDSKGRWYSSNLVRWPEDGAILKPIGGWDFLERADQVAVASCQFFDGGSFTDETTAANDATVDDVTLMFSGDNSNDVFYVAHSTRFTELFINVSTAWTGGGTLQWQYWNGTAWVALSNVEDATVDFSVTGTNGVTWDFPFDWEATTVNSVGPRFYVRAVNAGASTGTAAFATQLFIGRGPVTTGERNRALHTWRANDGVPQAAYASQDRVFHYASGVQTEITPAGITAGNVDAEQSVGAYGDGAYGSGPYGEGNQALSNLVEATTFQLDNFGEDLLACSVTDGTIYIWDKSAGGLMTALSNAPTGNLAVVVTPEDFVVALGSGGDVRRIAWSDQRDATTWTAASGNQAGDFDIPGPGQIMFGRRSRNETLIWTDYGLYTMRYIGGDFIYSVQTLGDHCGAASRNAGVVANGRAYWMGQNGFFGYDGFVEPLPSPVADFVFSDINRIQISKMWCMSQTAFNEVWWFYPSASSNEPNRYVSYNYVNGSWAIGVLRRGCGTDQGAFDFPLLGDNTGRIYRHETGLTYLTPEGAEQTPSAETGVIELGNGDRLMCVRQILPDERNLGDVDLSLYTADYPTDTEVLNGPFTITQPTDVRLTARQMRMRLRQINADWRFGTTRLDVVQGPGR